MGLDGRQVAPCGVGVPLVLLKAVGVGAVYRGSMRSSARRPRCRTLIRCACGVQADMGLDGGTYVSRSDVLRRQSWRASQADTSRSTRGGAVSTATVYQAPQLDANAER